MDNLPGRGVRVSVLIPVYNDDRLKGCLEALAAQTLPRDRFEVLVIDNGSKEPQHDLVTAYPFARMLSEPTPGSYAARNRALPEARGDVIAFTDADCVPDPRWLEAGLAMIDAAPGPIVIAGRVDVFAKVPGRPTAVELIDIAFAFDQKRTVEASRYAVTANVITPKAVFDRIGTFDQTLLSGADGEWSQRAAAAGIPVVYGHDAAVAHPARAGMGEILRKRRRTVGGRMQRGKNRGRGAKLRAAMGKVLPSASRIARGRRRLKEQGYGGLAWVRMAWIEVLMHYAGVAEYARIRMGGVAERR